MLADVWGLDRAFQLIPLTCIASALMFFYAKRHYLNDIQRLRGEGLDEKATVAACEVQS
ncbi:hypothetical protein D3C71_2206270 [compost metagenome]